MSININILEDNKLSYGSDVVYKRLHGQTPLDFAVSYLESIESLFDFYKLSELNDYQDFYNNDKYRIRYVNNDMQENLWEATTKTD